MREYHGTVNRIINYQVIGLVLAENKQMLKLGRKLGFAMERSQDCAEYELTIKDSDMNVE